MKKLIIASILTLMLLTAFHGALISGTYSSIRCGTWLIDIGASNYEVIHKCGQPTDIVKSKLEIITHNRIIPDYSANYAGSIYDYFITSGVIGSGSCSNHDRLLMLYFQPKDIVMTEAEKNMSISRYIVTSSYSYSGDSLIWECTKKTIVIEKYTYNLGPTNFIRYFTFENSILVKIEGGDYGF